MKSVWLLMQKGLCRSICSRCLLEVISGSQSDSVSPSDHHRRGPFATLEKAVDAAGMGFVCTDGVFWDTKEEADAHAIQSEVE